jgi:hypothetical protein
VRRLAALITGIVGGFAALRWLRGARRHEVEAQPEEGADPRAETLRRQLAEARAALGDEDEFDAREVPIDRAEPVPLDLDERRRRVHAEGRAQAEAMRRPGGDSA